MSIHEIRPEPVPPGGARPVGPVQSQREIRAPRGTETGAREDSVQISEEGRALASSDAAAPASGSDGSLTPERVTELRRWIGAGGHNATDVARAVARHILDSGDL